MTVNTSRPSRRTLIAGAAWSAPAVVVASAAPAHAGSTPGTPPLVTVTSISTEFSQATVGGTLRNYLDVTCAFANQNTDPTTAMSVLVDVVPIVGDTHTLVIYDTSPGWQWAASTNTTTGISVRFNKQAPQLAGTPDTVVLFFRVWMTTPTSQGVLSVRPTPTPGAGVPAESPWPQIE